VGASVRHTPTMNHRKPAGTKRKTERKRKDERKMDRWAKEGERGEGPGGEMARGRGGEGRGGVGCGANFFLFGAKFGTFTTRQRADCSFTTIFF